MSNRHYDHYFVSLPYSSEELTPNWLRVFLNRSPDEHHFHEGLPSLDNGRTRRFTMRVTNQVAYRAKARHDNWQVRTR